MDKEKKTADKNEYMPDENNQLTLPGLFYDPKSTNLIRKPNMMINSIGKITALSLDATDYALAKLEYRDKAPAKGTMEEFYYSDLYKRTGTDFSEGYVAEFTMNEFRKEYGITSGSTYTTLNSMFNEGGLINSLTCMYRDNDIWSEIAVIIGTVYDTRSRKLYVKFNPDVGKRIFDPKAGRYIKEDRDITKRLRSTYSRKLYEFFKSEFGREVGRAALQKKAVKDEYCFEYDIAFLKFLTQIIEVDTKKRDEGTREILRKIKAEDYEAAARLYEKNGKTIKFSDFNRYALKRAFNDINGFEYVPYNEYLEKCVEIHKTDIHFWYEPIRNGAKGEVKKIKVYVKNDKPEDAKKKARKAETKVLTEINIESAMDDIYDELMPLKIPSKDVRKIAAAAGYDVKEIKRAKKVFTEYNKRNKVNNVTGFFLKAIEEKYDEAVSSDMKNPRPSEKFAQENPDLIDEFMRHYDNSTQDIIGRIHIRNDED